MNTQWYFSNNVILSKQCLSRCAAQQCAQKDSFSSVFGARFWRDTHESHKCSACRYYPCVFGSVKGKKKRVGGVLTGKQLTAIQWLCFAMGMCRTHPDDCQTSPCSSIQPRCDVSALPAAFQSRRTLVRRMGSTGSPASAGSTGGAGCAEGSGTQGWLWLHTQAPTHPAGC